MPESSFLDPLLEERRILVVDSSNLVRRLLARHLQKVLPNAVIETAATGEAAMERLQAGQERYDLITTALMLPDMDGLELCRTVRESEIHGYTPVLVVSSDADERPARKGFEAGVTEYFDKSRGNEALAEFIKDFVQRNAGFVGRVLFVEDSPTAAAHSKKVLRRQGLLVEHVQSAEDAAARLEEMSTLRDLPDLVITDFMLRGEMTGGDLLHFIRTELHLSPQDLPVLVVTGQSAQEKHAEVLHRGANDFVEKPFAPEILVARIKSLILVKQVFSALHRQSEHMRRMAVTDSLTGTFNKRFLLEHGDEFLARAAGGSTAVLITDIDHFKQINDTHGHLAGDKALAEMGQLLRSFFRDENRFLVCRFGGEEFVVLERDLDTAGAAELADALRQRIAALQPAGIELTASIGIAATDIDASLNLSQLIARADEALYAAKEAGRDRVYCAGPERPTPFRTD